jgi:hypothetical protein
MIDKYPISIILQFGYINNIVEYEACTYGLKVAA